MHVETITIDRATARGHYLNYLKDVRCRQAGEIATIKNCYRELSRGRVVIDLVAAMRKAASDHRGYPRLAIVRAHRPFVAFHRGADRAYFTGLTKRTENCWIASRHRRRSDEISFRTETLPGKGIGIAAWIVAQVPLIPPQFRPQESNLPDYRLLFEPVWERVPPVDPILLKRLGGNMYVVCSQWDLTDVERAVLSESS
jgi:hypothetical protein